jgi:hypothetical protein
VLINQAARDLYDEEAPRWAALESWVKDPDRPDRAAHLHQLDSYFKRWHEVDNGRWLSDPNEIDGSYDDLEVAENYASDLGYSLPPGHGKRKAGTTEIVNVGEGVHEVTGLPTTIADQQALSDTASKTPILGSVTDPKDLSWCQRAGVPSTICGKEGLHMPEDKTPLYILGGGLVALFLGGAYVSYKAAQAVAPVALRLAAPELAPHVEKFRAARAAGGSGRQHIEDMIVDLAARQRAGG